MTENELEEIKSYLPALKQEIEKLREQRLRLKLAGYNGLYVIFGARLATIEREYNFLTRYMERHES